MRKLFMCNLVGNFKMKAIFRPYFLTVCGLAFGAMLGVSLCSSVVLASADPVIDSEFKREPQGQVAAPSDPKNYADLWADQETRLRNVKSYERLEGISYIISGGIGLLGGLAGTSVTNDPLEKGIYAVFQSIGIASIGYGAYKWQIGDDQRLIVEALQSSKDLSAQDKMLFLNHYKAEKRRLEKQERFIKAITHGLIAALNFYNTSIQKQDGVKNALTFIGTANLLACISYSF
jgi:hypothetical protein